MSNSEDLDVREYAASQALYELESHKETLYQTLQTHQAVLDGIETKIKFLKSNLQSLHLAPIISLAVYQKALYDYVKAHSNKRGYDTEINRVKKNIRQISEKLGPHERELEVIEIERSRYGRLLPFVKK